MSSEIRPLNADDAAANRALMNQAFSQGALVGDDNSDDDKTQDRIGLFEDGRLAASLHIRDFDVQWGSRQTYKMGGIAGVATYADRRGRGHVDRLLKRALETMHEKGQTISALYPFSWAFYRRYGWDWVGVRHESTIPLDELKSAPEGKNIVMLDGDQGSVRDRIAPAYTRFSKEYNGIFAASSHQWDASLRHADDRTTYVCHYPGATGDEGYMTWRFQGEGSEIRIPEFVANTPAAYKAFLSQLHYLGAQAKSALVALPGNTLLRSFTINWDLEMKTRGVFAGRVVDVLGALNQLLPPDGLANGSALVEIEDHNAPWNSGTYDIACEDGKVSAGKVMSLLPASIRMDIQAFSQAFWGTPSLAHLHKAGRITVDNPTTEGWKFLCDLLPEVPVHTEDFF